MAKKVAGADYSFRVKDSLIGAQMLFVAFGALVLVPLLTGLDPNVALFTAGLGTLVFQVITGFKVPVFLASSFAFIPALIVGIPTFGLPGTLCGMAAAGLLYVLLSLVIKIRGPQVVDRVLPPVVTGPVIMVIGLILAPVAVFMALGKTGDGSAVLFPMWKSLVVALLSLAGTIVVSLRGKGLLRLIPILCGILVGYIASLCLGMVSFGSVVNAPWLRIPGFVFPAWNLDAVLYVLPIAIAPAIEHVGDILAIGSISGRNYVKDPGLHRTLLGDGVATSLAAFLGGPPNTTYSEVSGAVALTKVFNPGIMTWAAITAIALAFVGKLGGALQTIPTPVMGGIMVLLFGAIAVVGMNSLTKVPNLMNPRNLIIIAVILVLGLGTYAVTELTIKGIGLAGIAGVVLNLVLPKAKEE